MPNANNQLEEPFPHDYCYERPTAKQVVARYRSLTTRRVEPLPDLPEPDDQPEPPASPEPTKESLAAEKHRLQAEIDDLQRRVAAIDEQIFKLQPYGDLRGQNALTKYRELLESEFKLDHWIDANDQHVLQMAEKYPALSKHAHEEERKQQGPPLTELEVSRRETAERQRQERVQNHREFLKQRASRR